MKSAKLLLLVCNLLLYSNCVSEAPSPRNSATERASNVGDAPATAAKKEVLLLFKAENSLERWADGQLNDIVELKLDKELPIGQFTLKSIHKEAITIDFPNAYYEAKGMASTPPDHKALSIPIHSGKAKTAFIRLSKVLSPGDTLYIFPNDARQSGTFTPCFACPHWMAEQYSYLAPILNNFKTKNQ